MTKSEPYARAMENVEGFIIHAEHGQFVEDSVFNLISAAFLCIQPDGTESGIQLGAAQTRIIMDYMQSKAGLAALRKAKVQV